jgi:hypothetical protein
MRLQDVMLVKVNEPRWWGLGVIGKEKLSHKGNYIAQVVTHDNGDVYFAPEPGKGEGFNLAMANLERQAKEVTGKKARALQYLIAQVGYDKPLA